MRLCFDLEKRSTVLVDNIPTEDFSQLSSVSDFQALESFIEIKSLSGSKTTYELQYFSTVIVSELDKFIDINAYQVDSLNRNILKRVHKFSLVNKRLTRVQIHRENTVFLDVMTPQA